MHWPSGRTALKILGDAVGVSFGLIGIGGVSQDLEQWRGWLDFSLAFLAGNGGRWLFSVAGVSLILFVHGLPQWTWHRVMGRKGNNNQADLNQAADNEAELWVEQLQERTNERDGALRALKTCKNNFAIARLRWFAERARIREVAINVTIRFATYDDINLVKQIEKLFQEHTEWPVEIDGTNKPVIMPDEEFKVLFESGISQAFNPVAMAFQDGELIDAVVGVRMGNRATNGDLVVEVLPTVKP